MELIGAYTIAYLVLGAISTIIAGNTTWGEAQVTIVFWPLIFIKWSLKQLFNILFKDWKD